MTRDWSTKQQVRRVEVIDMNELLPIRFDKL